MGSEHGPAVLSEEELADISKTAPAAELPDWAVGNYPEWLDPFVRCGVCRRQTG